MPSEQTTQLEQSDPRAIEPGYDQRRASDPKVSAWVAASAGSGKTKVLADRVIRLLLEGILPQRILCLTFTRATAAEMSIRIMEILAGWTTCDDDKLRLDLIDLMGEEEAKAAVIRYDILSKARQLFATVLECPGGMRIRTLHSFCQETLARFPLEAGISPGFTVVEETDAAALRREVRNDLLLDAVSGRDPQVASALESIVCDLAEEKLSEVLNTLMADAPRLEDDIRQAGSLAAMMNRIRVCLGLSPHGDEDSLHDAAIAETCGSEALLAALRQLAEEGSKLYAGRAKKALEWMARDDASKRNSFDDYCRCFVTGKYEKFGKFVDKDFAKDYPDHLHIIEIEADHIVNFITSRDALKTVRRTESAITLALGIVSRYEARKKSASVLDYDDLINKTRRLLERADTTQWVLYKLDGGLSHILLDEAQDTSLDQWQIVKSLTEAFFSGYGARDEEQRTLFVVGDEKQSIYSFRKADPQIFRQMRDYFVAKIEAANQLCRQVPFNVSFRSAPAILAATDAVFANPDMQRGVSLQEIKHHSYHHTAVGRVEVWPLVGQPVVADESADDDGDDSDNAEENAVFVPNAAIMAEKTAMQIQQWLQQGLPIFDRKLGGFRAVTAGDIMILLQNRGKLAGYLVRKLKRHQIPVAGLDRMDLLEQMAVKDLLALLDFMLLPDDDLNLATVLRCPLIGCDDNHLMSLAIGRTGTLWRSLNASLDPDLLPVREWLRGCLDVADTLTPLELLTRVLVSPCPADSGSGRRAIVRRLGHDAIDPINELLNMAESFARRHSSSLQAFLHWLTAENKEVKRVLDNNGGEVRIITVHSAKGLEAPVVILADAGNVPKTQKISPIMRITDGNNTWPIYVGADAKGEVLENIRKGVKEQQQEENRRLLYVAMTRAACNLYVGGYQSGKKASAATKPKSSKGGRARSISWHEAISAALLPKHAPSAAADNLGHEMVPSIVFADAVLPTMARGAISLPSTDSTVSMPLPMWARELAKAEPPIVRPLSPSRLDSDEGTAVVVEPPMASPLVTGQDWRFARGRIVHRLLQSLPDVASESREAAALHFLASGQHGLNDEEQAEICQEVLAILNHSDFAPLFSLHSRAEVPIAGMIGEREVAGQIDRLCIMDDEVLVVDYKTNRPPPADQTGIPNMYVQQMTAYAALLRQIYPNHRVRCFLLWTYNLRMMELDLLRL